jgi:putative endonuclease
VRCADGTLYTGIARDVHRRIEEHNGVVPNGAGRGARYTRSRRPVTLVYEESAVSRSAAARRENAIKRLTRSGKEDLLRGSPVLEA